MRKSARGRFAGLALLLAIVASICPAAALSPVAVSAEGRYISETGQTSADPSGEIVYIDKNGVIRVLDTQFQGKEVKWFSPDGGWRNMALGDFNNDGDMEIIAVKGSGSSDSVVAIYDPVVTSGSYPQGQIINDIPWKELARITLPERPETVAAGNFDPNVAGDEFLVVRKVIAGESSSIKDTRIVIYKQSTANGAGTAWIEHVARNFDTPYERVAVANVDNAGGDEIALIAPDVKVEVYQPDQNFRRLFEYGSDCRPPKDASFGQYIAGGFVELLMTKKQNCTNSSIEPAFQVFQYSQEGGVFPDKSPVALFTFEPEPNVVFAGDINGSGDDEAILMRFVDSSVAGAKRLFVRGDGNDGILQDFFDGLGLDSDNAYRTGTAGDIDGDGKDEIIIVRDNNIRWYPDAHNSAGFVNYTPTDSGGNQVGTNKRSIAVGDLDKLGANAGPQFQANISKLERDVNYGFITTGTFIVKNGGTEESIPFFASVDGNPPWLTLLPNVGAVPGKSSSGLQIKYTVDARNLALNQTYTAQIRIQNNGTPAASNSPLLIPVALTVKTPPFAATPTAANVFIYPCQGTLAPQTVKFNITGPLGTKLISAQVFATPSLASAANLVGTVYLGKQLDANTLAVVDAAGTEATLQVAPATISTDGSVSAAGAAATEVVSYPSDAPWITSVTVPTTTLPTTMTLIIDPSRRTRDFDFAGLVLVGPSGDTTNPIVARVNPIGLACANSATWMPVVPRN